jgi:hypothetical protein
LNSPKFEVLQNCPDDARNTLACLRGQLDVDCFPEDMQYLIFATALFQRLFGKTAEPFNLYLRSYEQAQIHLFSLLAARLPLVPMAGTIANELIAGLVCGQDCFTLLDVGIGVGRQEVELLNMLAQAHALPRQLTVVGVDPGEDSLRTAEQSLTAAARGLKVGLRFIGIPRAAETLGEEDWALLLGLPGPRIVNAAFAMHHIAWQPEGEEPREVFFRRLREWSPSGVVLCEPSSNHHRASLRERFHNCWRHFYYTFQLLEELDIPRQEKNTLKGFFAREVEDILSTRDEQQRSERHEHVSAWLERLVRNGFRLEEHLARPWSVSHPAIRIRPRHGYVGLEYRDETIVAVICATGAGGKA